MKIIYIWALILMQFVFCTACSKEEGSVSKPAPEFKSSVPENNADNVELSTEVIITFDEVVTLTSNHGITLNGEPANVEVSFTKLIITAVLENATTYSIIIPQGAVVNTFDVPLANEVKISFTTKDAPVIDNSALEFVAKMGVGWNLGNTLDAKGTDETVWGNPYTTKEMIDAIKAKGFQTLRVPVTWQYHMGDAPDFKIEEAWLDRVEEVVNYGLDNGMYVIVNIHHDEEWIVPTNAKADVVKDQLGKVWAQIATRFKAYDNHLVFETLNEPRLIGSANEWTGGTAEGRACLNQFHKVAVDAIRNTGDRNTDRYIMISTYAASSIDVAINDLELPSSPNLIVSIHNYYPYELCLGENGKDWGTEADKLALDNEFDRIYNKFITNGTAVVMGEWGNLNHDNLQDRIRHAQYYSEGCIKRGICPIWWDNGNSNEFGIFDRRNIQWTNPDIANAIVQSVTE
nr:cellulase family glycosylhydrolase [uncultured Carboxylicivirga sp.]